MQPANNCQGGGEIAEAQADLHGVGRDVQLIEVRWIENRHNAVGSGLTFLSRNLVALKKKKENSQEKQVRPSFLWIMRMRTLAVAWISAWTMAAQTPPVKVAVVSLQGAIVGTKEGQKAAQELDAKVQPRKKEFEQRQNEIAQLEDQLNKGGSVLSDERRSQLVRDVEQKKKKLERDMTDAQESLNAEQQRLLEGFGQKMVALISKYAKDNGYALVLDDSNPNSPILYAATAIDITQDIIGQYDKLLPGDKADAPAKRSFDEHAQDGRGVERPPKE